MLNVRADLLSRWKWIFISIDWWNSVCAIAHTIAQNICIFIIYFPHFSPFLSCHSETAIRRTSSGEQTHTDRAPNGFEPRVFTLLSFIHSLTYSMSHISQYIHLSIYLFVDILYITALKVIDTNIKLIFANSKINDQCVNEFGIWYVMVFQRRKKNSSNDIGRK